MCIRDSFKPLLPVQYPRRRADHLKMVEGIRFDTGKPRPRRFNIFCFNGKGEKLCLDKVLILGFAWGGDSAAYLTGRAFGKHKLAPVVSPNKRWRALWAPWWAAWRWAPSSPPSTV